jgi:HD domain
MPVFAHSMDVALLCLDQYPDWRERFPGFRLDVVLLGCVLHDLSKASSRHGEGPSHSHIMTREPALAVAEAVTALDESQHAADVFLDEEGIDHLWHVIAAHHGRWGKVAPETPEAVLLHVCDNFSATHHRIAPVDANDILPLLAEGQKWPQIGERLGVNRSVVKARILDACRAERVHDSSGLLTIWRDRGWVVTADPERMGQIERSRFVLEFALACPDVLLERVRPLLPTPD